MSDKNGLSENFTCRFSKHDRALLQKICEANAIDPSDFIRQAVRKRFAELTFLSDEEKKALGITVQL
ncbi:MAG: hypothetical protein V1857_06200 [archaeon]